MEKKLYKKTTVALKPEIIRKANELQQRYRLDLNLSLHRTQLVELLINEAHARLMAKKQS